MWKHILANNNGSSQLDSGWTPELPKIDELNLHYWNKNMKDDKTLADYGISGGILSAASTQLISNENLRSRRLGETNRNAVLNSSGGATDRANAYDITLIILKRNNGKINIGIDLTFNNIKDVRWVEWSQDAPDFREVTDGMCWIWYWVNEEWSAFNQMIIINRGYGKFRLSSELISSIKWSICKSPDVNISNIGFVKSEWTIKGILKRLTMNKVVSSDKNYDSRLYVLKEMDYRNEWIDMEINVKQWKVPLLVRSL